MGRRGGPGGGAALALAAAAALAGCGNHGNEAAGQDPAPGQLEIQAEAVGPTAVLVRGRIGADGPVLEPVVETGARPTDASAEAGGGGHRLRGFDDAGGTVFDVRVRGTEVADLPGGPEEHFQQVIALPPGGALRLARVELTTADGRQVRRDARMGAAAMRDALADGGTFRVERLEGDRVRIRWDAARFPLVIVQDPGSGHVLAMARGGEATIATGADRLTVTASEGVRSGTATVRIR